MQNYNRNNMGAANHQRDMMTDASGNIYITGVSRDNTPLGGGYDMVTMKYNINGTLQWLSNFNYGNYATMGDDGVGLEMDSLGNLYAIGWTSYGENYNDDFLLLKYGTTLSVQQNDLDMFTMFPNPANDQLNIKLTNNATIADVTISDINGRKVLREKFNATNEQLTLSVENLETGLYIVTIETEAGSTTQKLVKR